MNGPQTFHRSVPGVSQEFGPIGTPCPSCGKRFTNIRKPRLMVLLRPIHLPLQLIIVYRLCGVCAQRYRSGGESRQCVLAAIEKFNDGAREKEAGAEEFRWPE